MFLLIYQDYINLIQDNTREEEKKMNTLFPALNATQTTQNTQKQLFPKLPEKDSNVVETPYLKNPDGREYTGYRIQFDKGNVKEAYYYQDNNEKHTRATYADRDGDGNIDSASYFQDDENGKCLQSKFDFDYDGKIDQVLQFLYDESGNMTGILEDSDNDGIWDVFDQFDNNGDIVNSLQNANEEFEKD